MITLNFKDKELILTEYNNTSEDFETSGFSVNIDSSKLYVSKIYSGLNAQKADLRINDEIVTINGNSLIGLAPCQQYFSFNNIVKSERELIVQVKRDGELKAFRI